jgi:hypothetical protein
MVEIPADKEAGAKTAEQQQQDDQRYACFFHKG